MSRDDLKTVLVDALREANIRANEQWWDRKNNIAYVGFHYGYAFTGFDLDKIASTIERRYAEKENVHPTCPPVMISQALLDDAFGTKREDGDECTPALKP